jgi:hypothetical protein
MPSKRHVAAAESRKRRNESAFEGRVRYWIPEFRWNDGLYIEIKGYTSPQAEAKFAAFPHPLLIIR